MKRTPAPDTAGKTETFFTRRVRLITFLSCVALFLIGFAVLEGFDLFPFDNPPEDTRPEMTLDNLRALAKATDRVTRETLDTYRGTCETNEKTESTAYQIDIGERYFLMATFQRDERQPSYLTLTDRNTHTNLNLLEKDADLEAFLAYEGN